MLQLLVFSWKQLTHAVKTTYTCMTISRKLCQHPLLPYTQTKKFRYRILFQLFCNYTTRFRTPFVRKFHFVHATSTCKTIYFFLKVQIYLEMNYMRRKRNGHFQEALEYLFYHLLIDYL